MIICIDPGNRTGWATDDGRSGVEDLTPAPARKAKPGRPVKLAKRDGRILSPAREPVPAVEAEPDDVRLVKLTRLLNRLLCQHPEWGASRFGSCVLVHEAPLPHHASQRAAQLAFWWQATMILWVHDSDRPQGLIRRIEVPPIDLHRFALGRNPSHQEIKDGAMLRAAKEKLGYPGDDHNEGDAWWLREWARLHVVTYLGWEENPKVKSHTPSTTQLEMLKALKIDCNDQPAKLI